MLVPMPFMVMACAPDVMGHFVPISQPPAAYPHIESLVARAILQAE
jgi:hypothetical protein